MTVFSVAVPELVVVLPSVVVLLVPLASVLKVWLMPAVMEAGS